ncbi:MAG: DNA-protecting protein DprA [Armatimonadetes bacterium]|nr:DNA-protecting protein DprA [Armatimonadota bacterium]
MNDRTLLTVALVGRLTKDVEPVSIKDWRHMRSVISEIAGSEDAASDVSAWAKKNLAPEAAERVKERLSCLEEVLASSQELNAVGIVALTEFDDEYPSKWTERLGEIRAPLLFAAGNRALLNMESIGVVGSRDVDEPGREYAQELARTIAEGGFVLVSGGAKGVDREAMNAAFEAGGDSIGILSDSLEKACFSSGMADTLESGRVCLCSPFSPDAPFNVGNAMGRNKLIYAHSRATVVVSSASETGGTWAGAVEALKFGYCPVLVRDGDGVPLGNRRLIERGGIPLESAGELWEVLEREPTAPGSLF